eukprot:318305-Chlamydomonas_euryale.AAC.1
MRNARWRGLVAALCVKEKCALAWAGRCSFKLSSCTTRPCSTSTSSTTHRPPQLSSLDHPQNTRPTVTPHHLPT